MLKFFKKYAFIMSCFVLFSAIALPAPAFAGPFEDSADVACRGTQLNEDTAPADCPDTGGRINGLVRTAINIFSVVIGFIAVVMIIISGLRYITSAGDSNAVNGAKNTLLYAVVGLVIVALAQVIVRFVLSKTD